MNGEENRQGMIEAFERFAKREYSRGYIAGRKFAEAQAQVEFDLQIPTTVSIGIGMVCGVIASAIARLIWGAWL